MAVPEWVTMAAALGFGGGRPLAWQGGEPAPLPSEAGRPKPVMAFELEGRIPPEMLESILADRQNLAAGVLVKVDGPVAVRALLQYGHKFAEVTAYGILADYYTSHIAFATAGEAATIRYCLGLRRDPGGRAAVKRLVKRLLTFLGLGPLLYDYCLVYLEAGDDER